MTGGDAPAPHAVILAAGVGRRLAAVHAGPKSLLRFDGRSLIARHLGALRSLGVADIAVVTGFEAEALEAEIAAVDPAVRCVRNPAFRRGSVVSLDAAGAVIRRGADAGRALVLMDADVLFERAVLVRLLSSGHADCFLMDRDIEPGDEPVKLCLSDGGIVDFDKRPELPHDAHGESVGFFRFGPETARAIADGAARMVADGRGDAEYEAVLRALVLAGPRERFGFEDVTGLAWTEIDFAIDVDKAHALADRIAAIDGGAG